MIHSNNTKTDRNGNKWIISCSTYIRITKKLKSKAKSSEWVKIGKNYIREKIYKFREE